jgi:hypothetical protein
MAKIPHVELVDTVNTHRLATNRIIDSIGDLDTLTTDIKTTIVAALNTVDSNQGSRASLNTKSGSSLVDAVNNVLVMVDSDLGKPFSNLDTKVKTTIITAINSAVAMAESDRGSFAALNTKVGGTLVAAVNSAVAMQESDLGTLSSLTTKQKSTVVAAINSVQAERDSDLGNLASLTTDQKSTVVNALNSLVTNRGTMGSLATSATGNLVSAINELKLRVDLLDSGTSVNLDSQFSAFAAGDSSVRVFARSLADSNFTYFVNRVNTGDTALGARIDSDRTSSIARDDSDRTDILNRFKVADSALQVLIDSNTTNFTTNSRARFIAGTGLTYTQGTGEYKITNISPAIPSGSYGSSTAIPVLTVNARGQITSASTANVAGIDSVDFNNATGVLSIATSDGQTFNKTIGLGANTTDGLSEGTTNLYYTSTRTDSDITNKVIKSYIDNLNVDADTLDDQQGTYYLNYNNFTNTPTINNSTISIKTDNFLSIDSTGDSSFFGLNQDSNKSIAITHPFSGVTANTYGQTGTEDGQYIKSLTVDARGHISAISSDDLDDRYDLYSKWIIRGDAASTANVEGSRAIQFEGGNNVSTTLDTSGNPWKLTIAVNAAVGGTLLIKNSAGTTVKTIISLTTSN